MSSETNTNPFRRRLLIVLASVGAIGAIAAIATAASLALFYDPVAPYPATFAAGNVTLKGPSTASCTVGNSSGSEGNQGVGISPGYFTENYPGATGDDSGQSCSVQFTYTGSLDAFLALDVSVTTGNYNDVSACNGGESTTNPCESLYNPSEAGGGDGLAVYVEGTNPSSGTQAFGIGNDQTLSAPGTSSVDNTQYSETSTDFPAGSGAATCDHSDGNDCPVTGGFVETYTVYVDWPLDNSGDQNGYMNSWATVTLEEHAVQAADNPLFTCTGISDTQSGPAGFTTYANPDQPQFGWGGGFNSGLNSDNSVGTGTCPTADATGTGTDSTYVPDSSYRNPDPGTYSNAYANYVEPPGSDDLMTLYHPSI